TTTRRLVAPYSSLRLKEWPSGRAWSLTIAYRFVYGESRNQTVEDSGGPGSLPGIGAFGSSDKGPSAYSVGASLAVDASRSSQVIALPVYAESRPMIAMSVASAVSFAVLTGVFVRIAVTQSACSWTSGLFTGPSYFHVCRPVAS